MGKLAVAAGVVLLTLGAPLLAQQPPPVMDAGDFLVDGRSFLGKRVTITGCQFAWSGNDAITCIAVQGGNLSGGVLINGPTLERESLRRALRQCPGDPNTKGTQSECTGYVTGLVYDVFAELGVPNHPALGIKNATISWLR